MAVLLDDATSEFVDFSVGEPCTLPLTMACWAYDDESALNDRCIMQYQLSSSDVRYVRLHIGDTSVPNTLEAAIAFSASGVNADQSRAISSSVRTINKWHHFLGTVATNSRFAYLDGVGGTEQNTSGDPFSDTTFDSITVGQEGDFSPGDEWSGGIMWPAMWNIILGPTERAMLAAGVHPTKVRPDALVFFAPLENAQGYRDWISGTAGSATGTPVHVDGPHVMSDGGIIVPYNTANPPTVTDVNGDETFGAPSTGNSITGTNFL